MTTDKTELLRNYDPALFDLPADCVLVEYYNEVGEPVDFILMPLSNYSSPDAQAAYAYEIQQQADAFIDKDKFLNPEGIVTVWSSVAKCAIIMVATNIGNLYFRRSQDEEKAPTFAMTFQDAPIPKSENEADHLIAKDMIDRIESAVEIEILYNFKQALNACAFVWRHIFSSVLFAIEREHGNLKTIQPEEGDSLFKQYHDRDFSQYYQRAVYHYAAIEARRVVELLNPAEWPIDKLREYVGLEALDEPGSTGTIIKVDADSREELLDVLREVMQESDDSRGDILYYYTDGQNILQMTTKGKAPAFCVSNPIKQKAPRGGSRSPYDFSRLGEFYKTGYDLFEKAKKIHKTILHLPVESQHKIISDASAGKLDPDLISLMQVGEPYISTTSYLAAEWAARQCGVPADREEGTYSPAYILQKLTNQKKSK